MHRQARKHRDRATDVVGLLALWKSTAADQVLDRSGVDVGVAVEQRVDDVGAEVIRADAGQRPLESAPDRAANCIDNYGFRHSKDLLVSGRAAVKRAQIYGTSTSFLCGESCWRRHASPAQSSGSVSRSTFRSPLD